MPMTVVTPLPLSAEDECSMSKNVKQLFDLTGKVAAVTGGAGYLGVELCQALAEAGAKVVIADSNAEALDHAVSRLGNDGLDVVGVAGDLMSEEQPIREFIDKVVADHSRLDVLVNCVFDPAGSLVGLDDATFENFESSSRHSRGYAIASQQAARHMRKARGGSIINIGSMYGMVACQPAVYTGLMAPNPLTYAVDKAGVIQMTRYLAVHWARDNIRVNCISPGPFPNRKNQACADEAKMREFLRRLDERVPLGRTGEPWELKGAVTFLASEASSFVTGQNIVVDGGWTTW